MRAGLAIFGAICETLLWPAWARSHKVVAMQHAGKVALITGGARIGAAVAESLSARGVKIALSYHDSKSAAELTVARIEATRGGKAVSLYTDLSQPEGPESLVQRTIQTFGRVDILINMASVYVRYDFDKLGVEQWDRHMNVEARAAYLLALAVAPRMQRRRMGRIINFTDWIVDSGRPRYKGYLPYYAAKAAVLGLTQALALELAPEILVNAVAPGPIQAPYNLNRQEVTAVARATPMGRWGGAEEISHIVHYLIESEFVTGECIRVDGGRHLK